jgi:hypothetical protein
MRAKQLVESAVAAGAPPQQFWENDLEIGCESVLVQTNKKGFMENWIGHRNGRQIEIIGERLGLNNQISTRKKKSVLQADDPRLLPYLLVQEFAKFKASGAVVQWAEQVLPPTMLDKCRIGDDGYDTLAMCFALFQHDPQGLLPILHLDRIYKSGFARMKMKNNLLRPKQPFDKFLTSELVRDVLAAYDQSQDDGRASEFKNIFAEDDRIFVFVRRCERPDAIMQGTRVVHGHRREWIVLEFFDGAKRVNIASLSVGDSLAIANRIGSAYYGRSCEYENEVQFTYSKQIEVFVDKLKNDEDPQLTWVELSVTNSPLIGACSLRLSDPESNSIGKAVKNFEARVGKITSPIERIESIKVRFRDKRVSLLFEREEDSNDQYVVRYSDHRLKPKQRRAFEAYMRETHEIPVLSTEKRFADKA